MRKIILAAALTAALTLGAVPAFAANPASTSIKVTTDASAISVTLPIDITVKGPANGGVLTDLPAKTSYKLINNSTYPIHVANIVGAGVGGWAIAAGPLSTTTTSVTGTTGDIAMAFKPDGAGASWALTTTAAKPTGWSIAGKTVGATAGVDLPITVSGSISPVKQVVTADPAVSITYTVQPGTGA